MTAVDEFSGNEAGQNFGEKMDQVGLGFVQTGEGQIGMISTKARPRGCPMFPTPIMVQLRNGLATCGSDLCGEQWPGDGNCSLE